MFFKDEYKFTFFLKESCTDFRHQSLFQLLRSLCEKSIKLFCVSWESCVKSDKLPQVVSLWWMRQKTTGLKMKITFFFLRCRVKKIIELTTPLLWSSFLVLSTGTSGNILTTVSYFAHSTSKDDLISLPFAAQLLLLPSSVQVLEAVRVKHQFLFYVWMLRLCSVSTFCFSHS